MINKSKKQKEDLTMGNFLGAVWLFLLMPIFIIANIIHTQKKIREERERAEKEIALNADIL
jgi:large-conductance mechanosensitive channel